MKDMHNEEEGAAPGAELLRVDALLDPVLRVADRALLASPSSFAERVVAPAHCPHLPPTPRLPALAPPRARRPSRSRTAGYSSISFSVHT